MFEKEEPQEEYVVTLSDIYNAHNLYSKNGYADSIGEFYKSLERIVRCSDCAYFVSPSDYDLKPYCDSPHEGYAIPPNTSKRVKPDGFCAWGERRDDA